MSDDGCMIEHDLLSETAFDLLASSTVDRFARVAIEAGDRWSAEADASQGVSGVLLRVQHLWKQICIATKRDVEEVELAILLSALSSAGTPGVDAFVATISDYEAHPGDARNWIIGLARVLRQDRREAIASAATAKIQEILRALPDDEARKLTLMGAMKNYCPRCFDYNPRGGEFWCCYDSRGR